MSVTTATTPATPVPPQDESPENNPPAPAGASASPPAAPRPVARGKFIFVGDRKLFVRGVTYGTFRPDADGHQFPDRATVERDFDLMAQNGLNAVRTYTVPPRWLLDVARDRNLYLMVGLPWEQHIAFLSNQQRRADIADTIRQGVRACAGHPAVLCYSIGNEIPAPIVRWHGRTAVQSFLENLYYIAKHEDPDGLVTYVNYPSTEYLNLPFVDLFCFNVYLEQQPVLAAYLARLQNLAGNRPLLMAEIGLDSQRNGLEKQARVLDWQIRTTAAAGCAGAFIFAWTDEWYRGGHDIEDWDFGLVNRMRQPKPALDGVRNAFRDLPFPGKTHWPRFSVIVCTYNGSRTLRECLEHATKLDYPDYEVIVINDGSRDASPDIAREFNVRLITTENRGLSSARNTGMEVATGELLVYLDDDAYPDPHWLHYFAAAFNSTAHAAVGGPNLAPPGDGSIAECVVNAPGGPVHVLVSDSEAEHIPGCNMAFRRAALMDIGGFDPAFRVAGDDVDVCWRIQQRGWTIGFAPAAVVWHHRRNSIKAYWKQQQGYGKAEALLERKWPEKYNAVGHIKWAGQLYGKGLTRMLLRKRRVYHGWWGTAPFQQLHETTPSLITVLPTMPEWYLVVIALGGISWLALLWPKLVFAIPVFLLAAGATVWQAVLSASQASFPSAPRSRFKRLKLYALTAILHLAQPAARLYGRARHGLTALRRRTPRSLKLPLPQKHTIWSETWRFPEQALSSICSTLRRDGAVVVSGSPYDRWDIEVRGGLLGGARLLMTVEEHGAKKQLFRFRCWPKFSTEAVIFFCAFNFLALGAAADQFWIAYDVLALSAIILLWRIVFESASGIEAIERALERGLD